ncbi:hypothetical protein [Bacillus sp. 196mf]|uniref:hypothetical protein n=1 Tax=Bacillus sp. 196mf TaxID=1761754 RepID=UPI000D7C665F|nr:hypothetical protein [Bacillus sp. 196mf]PYE87929.1 hypothetical protein ATL10_10584 [Bacillus sp. 196mf]
MENYFYYKNLKMSTQLNIPGNFIYDGIQYLYLMEDIEDEGEVFSFFYNISVGIERLQKIILVLAAAKETSTLIN